MTNEEYRAALNKMTDAEFAAFNERFGGGPLVREARLDEFAHHPEYERRLCYLLNLKTEGEKMVEATVQAAAAAKDSAKTAWTATIISAIATAFALGALLVQIYSATQAPDHKQAPTQNIPDQQGLRIE